MADPRETRAWMGGVAAVLAALLGACGGSGEDKAGGKDTVAVGMAHYTDAVGDGGAAPDIRAVEVTSTPDGRITFRIVLGQFRSNSRAGVDLWLDTDANPETGNTSFDDAGGAEFLLGASVGIDRPGDYSCGRIPSGNGCFASWTENGWIPTPARTARISRTESGVTISISRSDLGNTNELNFYAVRPPPDVLDRAPGSGTFNYSLDRGGPRSEASSSSGEASDKAGGQSDGTPVVLTLASHDYDPVETPDFVAAAHRLSGGSIRINVKQGFRYYDVDYERGTIEDVQSGTVDLALIGARAWDAAGVNSFNSLVAPFLVDSYALERRVLQSSLSERMLDGVRPLGLVGIALLPGELRRPLGLSRPLVRPTDFRGARIGIRPGGVAAATFEALGARAEGFPAIPTGLDGFDGAESGLATINNNVYDRGARALTANVVLWPRVTTIVMNRETFDGLTGDQQDALLDAGREALDPLLATIRNTAESALGAICKRGQVRLAIVAPGDRAALSRAVQPVYEKLQRDPLTRRLIDEIEAMRRDRTPAPLRCAGARRSTVPSALKGLWRADVSRSDLRAVGAQLEQFARAEGSWKVEFGDGGWVAHNLENGDVYRGTLAVEGDVMRQTTLSCDPSNLCVPGHTDEYSWSVYRDKLELARIPGRPFNLAVIARPLTRAR